MQKSYSKNRDNLDRLLLHSAETLWPEELMFHLCKDRIYILFDKPISQCRNSCSKLVEDVVQINIAKRRKSREVAFKSNLLEFFRKRFSIQNKKKIILK